MKRTPLHTLMRRGGWIAMAAAVAFEALALATCSPWLSPVLRMFAVSSCIFGVAAFWGARIREDYVSDRRRIVRCRRGRSAGLPPMHAVTYAGPTSRPWRIAAFRRETSMLPVERAIGWLQTASWIGLGFFCFLAVLLHAFLQSKAWVVTPTTTAAALGAAFCLCLLFVTSVLAEAYSVHRRLSRTRRADRQKRGPE